MSATGRAEIFWFVLLAWAGLGACFGPAVLYGLYSRKATGGAVLAGMIVGAVTAGVWKLLREDLVLYELIPAFFLSCLVIHVLSRLSPNRNRS